MPRAPSCFSVRYGCGTHRRTVSRQPARGRSRNCTSGRLRTGHAKQQSERARHAARINHATPQLADVDGFSARMLARRRAAAGPDAAHEQHARAVIVFQIVNISLEPRDIADANAGTRTGPRRYDKTGRVAVGVGPVALMSSNRRRDDGRDGVATAAAVAINARRTNMHFSTVGGERDEHSDPGKWDKCGGLYFTGFHERLPDASDARAERSAPSRPSMYFL